MSANWKDRYTDKQLEKKRRADRLSQQRLRKESKRAVAELEEQLHLSTQGNNAALVRRLLDENARLRSELTHYRSRMANILALSQDCISHDRSEEIDELPGHEESTQSLRSRRNASVLTTKQHPPPVSGQLSIYFRAVSILTESLRPAPTTEITEEVILQSVTAWKLSSGCGFGSEFVFKLFGISQSPNSHCSPVEIEKRILSDDFWSQMLQALIADESYHFNDSNRHEPPRLSEGSLPRIEEQKRIAALCTYETLKAWKPFFASRHEWSAVIWSILKYIEFLSFPSIGNLKEIPRCLWPSHTQLSREYPSIVDFLLWPRLRDALATNSQQYDLNSLCLELVQNFELVKSEEVSNEPIFVSGTNATRIALSPGMRDTVYNGGNLQMRRGFERKFPSLRSCFPKETGHTTKLHPSLLGGTLTQRHCLHTPPIEEPCMASYETSWFDYENEANGAQTGRGAMPVSLLDSWGYDSLDDLLSAFPINSMENAENTGSNMEPGGHYVL